MGSGDHNLFIVGLLSTMLFVHTGQCRTQQSMQTKAQVFRTEVERALNEARDLLRFHGDAVDQTQDSVQSVGGVGFSTISSLLARRRTSSVVSRYNENDTAMNLFMTAHESLDAPDGVALQRDLWPGSGGSPGVSKPLGFRYTSHPFRTAASVVLNWSSKNGVPAPNVNEFYRAQMLVRVPVFRRLFHDRLYWGMQIHRRDAIRLAPKRSLPSEWVVDQQVAFRVSPHVSVIARLPYTYFENSSFDAPWGGLLYTVNF